MKTNCQHLVKGKCTHEKVANYNDRRCMLDMGIATKCAFQIKKTRAKSGKK